MVIACKCGGCGHIEMSEDSQITFEFDFLEKRVVYVCNKCKKQNVIDFNANEKAKKAQPLPGIRVM